MEKYLFTVRHPQYGEASVTAEDRLHAVIEAAHSWGVMKWSGIARACEVIKGEKVKEKPSQALRASSPRGGAKNGRGRTSSTEGGAKKTKKKPSGAARQLPPAEGSQKRKGDHHGDQSELSGNRGGD